MECERLSWLRYNQSKLRANASTHLCELLADAGSNKNGVNELTVNNERDNLLNVGRLVVLPSTHISNDRYVRQNMDDVIAISNSVRHPDIITTISFIRTGQR